MKLHQKTLRTLACALFAATAAASANATWEPGTEVTMMVGVGPGGAHDRTARIVQSIWQKDRTLPVPLVIVNRPGGGGTRAWSQLTQQKGNPHYLAITGPTLLTNNITGVTPLTYTDFTQIAVLYSEAIAFAVPAGSSIRDGKDLVQKLVSAPGDLTVGIATVRGNTNHIAMASVTKVAGGDPKKLKVVIFDSGGKVSAALMGGHVDVVASNASNLVAQAAKAGKNGLRLVAVSAPERIPGGLADVPTWKELGVNSVVANFRGVMAPQELADDQVRYWITAFEKLTQKPEWQQALRKNLAFGKFMPGAEADAFLKAEHADLRDVLQSLGLAR